MDSGYGSTPSYAPPDIVTPCGQIVGASEGYEETPTDQDSQVSSESTPYGPVLSPASRAALRELFNSPASERGKGTEVARKSEQLSESRDEARVIAMHNA